MNRRHLLKHMGVVAHSALSPAGSRFLAAQIGSSFAEAPSEPKLFIRDDGRHAAGMDQFEPPLDRLDLNVSVDQLIGSGVDALLFSVGVEGGTVVYDSRVAQKLGDNVDKWTHPVHYRDARHLRQMIADGLDRLKLLCDRCHGNQIWFFPSLCIDIGSYISPRGHGRTSDFVFNNPQFQVGKDNDPRGKELPETRFSFLHPEVRRERFLICEELLSRYETDGIEIFANTPPPCRLNQAAELSPILTQWIRELRAVAQKAERAQRRRKRILVSLPASPVVWSLIGYDVARWVSERLVDGLLCGSSVPEKFNHDLDLSHAVALVRSTSSRVIATCGSGIDRQFTKKATQPMISAAAASAYRQGANAFSLDDPHWFPWPWAPDTYQTLRLLRDPVLLETADKIYSARSVAAKEGEAFFLGARSFIAQPLTEGRTVSVQLGIADDLAAAGAQRRVKSVQLRVRVTNLDASLNQVNVQLNGRLLPADILYPNDLTYRIIKGGVVNPYGYVFSYALRPEYYPKLGQNTVQVTLAKRDPNIDVPFDLYSVECAIQYRPHRNFERELTEY